METISKQELYRKKRLSGLLGFIFIALSIMGAFILGYPYSAFLIEESGSFFLSELNIFFVIGGVLTYGMGVFFAVAAYYVDRKPFNVEHPVRRRHRSLPRFLTWLLVWNFIDIFIIGNFARTQLELASFWQASINDFIVRYLFVLGSIILVMLVLMTFMYNQIIPDRSIFDKHALRLRLVYVAVSWIIIVVIFSFGVFIHII